MATTRVKRTGSNQRKSQRLHGRKTKRQHKHHNRITRRQRGGMFRLFAKRLATKNINPKYGPLYGGIEVFKADVDGVLRYYIGNKPIDMYIASAKPANNAYGKLIQSKLNGIKSFVDEGGGAFNGMTFIDQVNFDKFSAQFPSAASASEPVKLEILLKPEGIQFGDQLFEWPLPTRNVEPLEITQRMFQRVSFKNEMIKSALKGSIDKIVFFKRITDTPGGTTAGTTFVSIYFLESNEQAMCALANYREAIKYPSVSTVSIQLLSDDFSPKGTPPNQPHVATILLTDPKDTDFTNQIDRFFGTWYKFYNGERCKSEPSSSLARRVDALSLSP